MLNLISKNQVRVIVFQILLNSLEVLLIIYQRMILEKKLMELLLKL